MIPPLKLPKIALQAPYKVALGTAVGLVALVWLIRYAYLPVIGRIGAQQAQLNDLAVKVADAKVLTEALPRQEAALREAQTRYRAFESRVGEGQSVPRILDGLGKWAKDHRLEVVAVQPRTADAVEPPLIVAAGSGLTLRTTPLALRLKGRYRQLGEFLGKLSAAPFVGTVRKLTVRQPSSESAQLEADVVLAVYLKERAPTP
jgi:Tfp pilus assembly protein PilO